MPTEELKFEDLIKEYIEVIENTDVTKLREENKVIKVDIERKEQEVEGIDSRIEQIQAELDSLNENPTIKLEYPEAIKDKEDKLKESKDFKEKKLKEIEGLKNKTKENNKKIRKVNNIGKDVIKRAEEKINKENEELEKKIKELEDKKEKYGIKRKDKDGKEYIQYTKEEQVFIKGIDEDIDKLEHAIKDNRKAFLLFKKDIEDAKKDKEAFLALKNKVKGKEELIADKTKNKDNKKVYSDLEEPLIYKAVDPTKKGKEEPTAEQTIDGDGKKVYSDLEEPLIYKAVDPTKKRREQPTTEQTKDGDGKKVYSDLEEPTVDSTNSGKESNIPGDTSEQPKADKESDYKRALEAYKGLLIDYKADLDELYKLQEQYENGEIEYSKYEEYTEYIIGRSNGIEKDYEVIKKLYDELSSDKSGLNKSNETEIIWHPKLTQEQIEELIAEGIKPGDNEYNMYLWNHGIDPSTQPKPQEKETEIKWHPKLTQEQIEELIAEYIKPGDNEYNEYLWNHGINPFEKIDEKGNDIEAPEKPNEPMFILEKDKGQEPPQGNLPLRSGLQVYDDVLHEVGYVKGTKAIAAHDFINKFNFFGLNKLVAGTMNLFTGRKKEVNRIVEILDDLQEQSPEDYELLMKDFLLKDNDTRNIMKYKVNEIFLEAVAKKCQKDFAEQEKDLSQIEQGLKERYEELEKQLETAEGEERIKIEQQMIATGQLKANIRQRREELEMRPRRIREGKEDKSYDRKNNIKGGLKANRNPDNREEIHELRKIEDIRLQAIADGDKLKEQQAKKAMEQYESSQTEYKYTRKGKVKISLGAFDAKEGEIKVIDHQKNMAAELMGTGAMILTSAGLSYLSAVKQQQAAQQQIDQAIKNAETRANTQIDAARQTIVDAQSKVTGAHVAAGQESLQTDAIGVQAIGERTSALGSDFKISAQGNYPNLDATGVARANQAINDVNNFSVTGSNDALKLASILDKKADLSATYGADALKDLGSSAQSYYAGGAHLVSRGGVDHTVTAALEQIAGNFANSNTTLYTGVADVLKIIGNMNPQQIQNIVINSPQIGKNLWPIIISAMPGVAMGIQAQRDSKSQRRDEIVGKEKTDIKNEPKKETTKKTLRERIKEGKESLKEKIAAYREKRQNKKQQSEPEEER